MKSVNCIQFIKKHRILSLFVFFVILVLGIIGIGDPYMSHVLIIGGIYGFLAIGLNVVTGLCGQINLGMAGFYAIGSYTSALLSTKLGVHFLVAFPLSIVFAAIAGLIIGYPALKVRGGVYLVLITTSFASIIQTILTQWVSLTNGPMGVVGIESPSFLGLTIQALDSWLILTYFLLLVAMIVG